MYLRAASHWSMLRAELYDHPYRLSLQGVQQLLQYKISTILLKSIFWRKFWYSCWSYSKLRKYAVVQCMKFARRERPEWGMSMSIPQYIILEIPNTQSMIAYMILTEYSWKFQWAYCGILINMPYYEKAPQSSHSSTHCSWPCRLISTSCTTTRISFLGLFIYVYI